MEGWKKERGRGSKRQRGRENEKEEKRIGKEKGGEGERRESGYEEVGYKEKTMLCYAVTPLLAQVTSDKTLSSLNRDVDIQTL